MCYNKDTEREVIEMFNKEKKVRKWIDENYECVPRYDEVYLWWCDEKISDELWSDFCLECVFEIANVSDVLKRMKERDSM